MADVSTKDALLRVLRQPCGLLVEYSPAREVLHFWAEIGALYRGKAFSRLLGRPQDQLLRRRKADLETLGDFRDRHTYPEAQENRFPVVPPHPRQRLLEPDRILMTLGPLDGADVFCRGIGDGFERDGRLGVARAQLIDRRVAHACEESRAQIVGGAAGFDSLVQVELRHRRPRPRHRRD